MPLLIIHSLPPTDPTAVARMIADVRDSGASALGCSPDNIWVIFHAVQPGWYVQGMADASVPQAATHPPIVIARAQVGRTGAERSAFVAAVAIAVGRGLSVPSDNVWIHYEEMRSEDVWFGGRWAA